MGFRFARLRLALLLSLSLLGSAACRSAPAPAAKAPEEAPRSTPGLFLYEVRGAAGATHLLGTIHVGFGFEEVLTADARARFQASTRVMTEADVATTDPEHLIQAALLPPERSLRAILGEPSWSKLRERLRAQLPAPMLDRLEPWLPAVMIGLQDLEKALAELKPNGQNRMMDVELVKQASALGKDLSYLETVAEQLAIFDAISLEEQVRELQQELEADSARNARALLTSFAAGDEEALASALFEDATSAPGFYDRVLFERNERWLPVIEREVARGGAFIAVGAAHLLGPRGLLAELVKRGYEVRRVGG